MKITFDFYSQNVAIFELVILTPIWQTNRNAVRISDRNFMKTLNISHNRAMLMPKYQNPCGIKLTTTLRT